MITFGKTSTKPNHLFGLLPEYFKVNDSYKDGNDEGLLERYLEIFCAEIDNEVSPYLTELPNITDASALTGLTRNNPTELLQYLSLFFGNPPDISTADDWSGTEAEYIILIRYMKHILQTKGTVKSLIYFLAIYGYELTTLTESSISLTKYDETPTPIQYDNNAQYDLGFTFYSGFDIAITDLAGTIQKDPTQPWLDDYLKPAIQKLIAPIWAQLGTITYTP